MTIDLVVENLRVVIQEAEEFGLLRTESGQVITGAIKDPEGGITLTED